MTQTLKHELKRKGSLLLLIAALSTPVVIGATSFTLGAVTAGLFEPVREGAWSALVKVLVKVGVRV
jgi:hypothetical protein